ncbi:30S ribosomal protein S14 [Candidatus Woesearchaeota archaeon]|nr:MAG: 30S ribosomal protein S14 [Candidatus Woesearchaeota archaeon]
MLNQIAGKPAKIKRYEKHNLPRPRNKGETTKKCERCGRTGAHISKYGINVCRQCFREVATKIGFKKYS